MVKWTAEHIISVDGEKSRKAIDMHLCTDEDYASFYEPTEEAANRLVKMKKNGGMMCLDWEKEDPFFAGYESNPDYKTLDLMFLPCSADDRLSGTNESRIPENCNSNRDELIKYLGPLQMVLYFNSGEF